MTLLYSDPRFLQHDTGHHPECAARLEAVTPHLAQLGLTELCERPTWEPARLDQLARVHAESHLRAVERCADQGGGRLDPDTVVSAASWGVARLAAGAVCDAVQRVVARGAQRALCLVRPPGHHALPDRAMGFCLFNNIAVAARAATEQHDLDRVLIVDWDVHHGNGTQDVFYEDGRVGFFSIHRWPFYPGTGDTDETGRGAGLGATRNLPTRFGTPRAEYLAAFAHALEEFATRIRPQLVLLSAGFDSHRADPIGSLGLEVDDFTTLTKIVVEVANSHAEGRLVSVLEGGYNPPVLAECVAAHLRALGPLSAAELDGGS